VLNHIENRTLLYRELGIMELDDCGIWLDKPINAAEWLTEDECPVPPAVPQEWMKEAGVSGTDLEDFANRQAEANGSKNAADGAESSGTRQDSGQDENSNGAGAPADEAETVEPERIESPRELEATKTPARHAVRGRPSSARVSDTAPEQRLSQLALKTAERENEARQPASRLLGSHETASVDSARIDEPAKKADAPDFNVPSQPRHGAGPVKSGPALRR
jgi:hypothetical protein